MHRLHLNYRASLWEDKGGLEAANKLNHELLKHADVVFGVENFNAKLSAYDEESFKNAANDILAKFPNLRVIATTLRDVNSGVFAQSRSGLFLRRKRCESA